MQFTPEQSLVQPNFFFTECRLISALKTSSAKIKYELKLENNVVSVLWKGKVDFDQNMNGLDLPCQSATLQQSKCQGIMTSMVGLSKAEQAVQAKRYNYTLTLQIFGSLQGSTPTGETEEQLLLSQTVQIVNRKVQLAVIGLLLIAGAAVVTIVVMLVIRKIMLNRKPNTEISNPNIITIARPTPFQSRETSKRNHRSELIQTKMQ
ncbi:Hypothetical_protein [Hexamita inflata]|uniref:Hypothetical_protein n=1 Tax=Hexamita inflata TaxID=28002 RepID=A0AA86NCS5_9EUKA|nr:Hypothetical protein HINF_LOCUS4401 [Hexamita inflata]CAI9933468.1 Hypothetical protein HINF_LOCUS21113 [Hexamita inflata]CAI9968942.1 Hypothetical protein HINF_LOCUS56587 [Hexamita inflata]